jgi:hypothetical protein
MLKHKGAPHIELKRAIGGQDVEASGGNLGFGVHERRDVPPWPQGLSFDQCGEKR